MRGPSARTLARALEIAGSRPRLTEALRVPPAELDAWLSGKTAPPPEVFIAALDIVARGAAPPRQRER